MALPLYVFQDDVFRFFPRRQRALPLGVEVGSAFRNFRPRVSNLVEEFP